MVGVALRNQFIIQKGAHPSKMFIKAGPCDFFPDDLLQNNPPIKKSPSGSISLLRGQGRLAILIGLSSPSFSFKSQRFFEPLKKGQIFPVTFLIPAFYRSFFQQYQIIQ